MDARMTRPTNPHPFTEIQISPVMIDQLHWAISLAQFAAFVTRIGTLSLHPAKFFLVRTLPDTMLAHVCPCGRTHSFSVILSIAKIHQRRAWLTAVVVAIGAFLVDVKLLKRQGLLAAVAAGGIRWRQSLNQASAFDRATSPFDFMGWWRQKRFAAVRTGHFNLAVVPRSMAFGKFITWRSIHALNDTP